MLENLTLLRNNALYYVKYKQVGRQQLFLNEILITICISAPGSAPRSVVVKSTETGSFEVSWLPPEYPNGRIIFYRIYFSEETHKSWESWQSTSATTSPKKISSGVRKNHRYAVRISSSTGSGAGPISKPFLVQSLKGGKWSTSSEGFLNLFLALSSKVLLMASRVIECNEAYCAGRVTNFNVIWR